VRHMTLADTDWAGIADAYNIVYEGYVMPFTVTAEWAEQHVRRFQIDLQRSPLWRDDEGNIVAMAALGVRGERGWVGGFGVASGFRGRGLSHALLDTVTDAARALGLRQVQLEVFTTNTAAIRTYQRGGYVHQRDLLILQRPAGPPSVDVDTTLVTPADPHRLLAARERIGSAPDWARERQSYAIFDDLQGLAVGDPDAPLALALYRAVEGIPRIHDIAALDVDSAQTLLAALIERFPEQAMLLVNEPEGSEALPALFDAGWQETSRQHEMLLTLA
jgi:GNAT superfamily N-acetyltransferase